MDLNVLAAKITQREGLQKAVSIGQVKEVLACLGQELRSMPTTEMVTTVKALVCRAGRKSKR